MPQRPQSDPFQRIDDMIKELNLSADTPPSLQSWKALMEEIHKISIREKNEINKQAFNDEKTASLTSSDASVKNFIGGICHEINNPLAVVQMRSEQLLDLTQSNDYDQELYLKSLNSIDISVKKMVGIVSRLRDFIKN